MKISILTHYQAPPPLGIIIKSILFGDFFIISDMIMQCMMETFLEEVLSLKNTLIKVELSIDGY